MNSFRSTALCILAAIGLSSAAIGCKGYLDTRPALAIGTYSVSQYLLKKYYLRSGTSTVAETSQWLDNFVDEQCVIALAIHNGYADRREVRRDVSKMERYMLTQTRGPYYDRIIGDPEVSAGALQRAFEMYQYEFDLAVVGNADRTSLAAILGKNPEEMTAVEFATALRRCQDSISSDVLLGRYCWPFLQMPEISEIVSSMHIGELRIAELPGFGTYVVAVLGKMKRRSGVHIAQDAFSKLERAVERQTAIKRHRSQVLRSTNFTFSPATGVLLMSECGANSTTDGLFPPCSSRLADKILFTYSVSGTHTVSAAQYRLYFNQRIVRPIPNNVRDIHIGAEDMVIGEIDDRDARMLGIDKEPQFQEDKKGFCGYVALELYKKEVLEPKITISDKEIAAYYQAHPASFTESPAVHGIFYKFTSLEDAAKWENGGNSPPQSLELTSFSTRFWRPDIQFVWRELVQLSVGARSRPFMRDGVATVFVKTSDAPAVLRPFKDARSDVRALLHAKDLASLLHECAVKARMRFGIKANIDYSSLRLPQPREVVLK